MKNSALDMDKNFPDQETADMQANTVSAPNAEQQAAALGAELIKRDGRVMLCFAGLAEAGAHTVPYDLVPTTGVLAKAGKWRNMAPAAQVQLVAERAAPAIRKALHEQVLRFATSLIERAEEAGLDPAVFLQALAQREVAVPVEQVFERIHQR
ncbi:MAG TPA: RNA helicase, partial [Noviherbaspirillum sp.]